MLLLIAIAVTKRVVGDRLVEFYANQTIEDGVKAFREHLATIDSEEDYEGRDHDPGSIKSLTEMQSAITNSPNLGPIEYARYSQFIGELREFHRGLSGKILGNSESVREVKERIAYQRAILDLGDGKDLIDYWSPSPEY